MAARILVVDDDAGIREVVSRTLEKRGHFVDQANDAQSAWSKLSYDIYELVVTDVKMPGEMTGLDLLKKIKSRYNMPTLVMSGFATMDMAVQALRLGADDFFAKPFRLEALADAVDGLLKREGARERTAAEPKGPLFEKVNFCLSMTFPSQRQSIAEMRAAFNHVLPAIGISKVDAHIIVYAAEEAMKNAIDHGNCGDPSKKAIISAELSEGQIKLNVSDEGRGFDWRNMEFCPDEANNQKGLYLIQNLVDKINFNDAGNMIQLIYNLNEVDPLI